jgi:NAD(P)-dependent dehydrogenase (short-subunit alcohol dehydrogenase family)
MEEKKIGLVTGANSGIGKEIALGLAKAGVHVIMVCRNLAKGERAREEIKALSGSSAIDLFIADLSSQAEIRALAKNINTRYAALHLLINNAGLVLNKKTLSVDGIEMTLATNHLAPFLLTQLLLPLLQKSVPARVINISSDAHKWGQIDLDDLEYTRRKYQFMKAYSQSKLLLNLTTFEYARKFKNSGVTFNCVHPGTVKTRLGYHDTNHAVFQWFVKLIKCFFISGEKGAETALYVALSPELARTSGEYFFKCKSIPAMPLSYDEALASKVWAITEKKFQ